jgi:hypothetical protein
MFMHENLSGDQDKDGIAEFNSDSSNTHVSSCLRVRNVARRIRAQGNLISDESRTSVA